MGRRSLLFGVVRDKDYGRMVQEVVRSGLFQRICLTRMHSSRALEVEELAALFGGYPDCAWEACEDVGTAFRRLCQNREEQERVYVAGSLYLVGEIKELLEA